jgi:hypothetical protein
LRIHWPWESAAPTVLEVYGSRAWPGMAIRRGRNNDNDDSASSR